MRRGVFLVPSCQIVLHHSDNMASDDKQKGPAVEEPSVVEEASADDVDSMPDLYPVIRAKIDHGRFSEITLTREDCCALGRMYNTDGIKGYASSVLRVVRNSPLFAVIVMLTDDMGFRAALGIPEEFQLLELPVFTDKDGTVYQTCVPADIVWAAVGFIQNTWGVKYGISAKFDPASMSDYEFAHFIARLKFVPEDEKAILAARKEAPNAVNTVLCALVRQSALMAGVVKKYAETPAPPPVDLLNLPEAPTSAPTEEPEQAKPAEEKAELPEPRQIPNKVIADEVCALIQERCKRSGSRFTQNNVDNFCETLRSAVAALESEGIDTNIAEMDGFRQGTLLATNSALAVTFAFTLMGADPNPFLDDLINAYLMIPTVKVSPEELAQQAGGEPRA